MIIKYLSVGLQSWFLYQQLALNPLFQMRYDSLANSKKQPSDSKSGWSKCCFHITPLLLVLPASKTWLSNLVSLTQPLLGADKPTISHLKEEILSYQWVQNFWIFLIDGYKLSQVQISHFQHGFGMLRGLPTSLCIFVYHSVIPWGISRNHTSSERGLKYLSYDLKILHTRFLMRPYEHQSYSK